MRIETSSIYQALEGALSLVDEVERERMQRILSAGQDSVQRALLDLLRGVADEVNAVGGNAVHAEIAYGANGAEFKVSAASPAEEGAAIEFEFDTGEIERLTLRLPSELKELAAFAAEQHGVSLNTWLTRLVSREASRRSERDRGSGPGGRGRRGGPGGGQSLKGWIGG